MLTVERFKKIRRIVECRNSATVAQLAAELEVSDATIRKDLKTLEERGHLRRTHGGAVTVDEGVSREARLWEAMGKNSNEKRKIARKAYEMIKDDEAIILDVSSTAGMICEHIKRGEKRNLTVVTNSAIALMELMDCGNVQLIMVGGQVQPSVASCVGAFATDMLRNIRVDKAFIGANGIDLRQDIITTPNLFEREVKRAMISAARETVVVADNTKFGKLYLGVICRLPEVDCIITDDGISRDTVELAKNGNVNIIVGDRE
ncbi:MAG: DeoR/GlpR family DNA-binding transcription regulator [Treponema sp.]|jgi:DeoR family fructose operon transcriptional repressor|nr:DeoR/GlpR family DNA-binding transcription regulator [Treponema sp.]